MKTLLVSIVSAFIVVHATESDDLVVALSSDDESTTTKPIKGCTSSYNNDCLLVPSKKITVFATAVSV